MKPEAATHPEMCIESMPRRQYVVRFHDTLLAVRLIPGEGGKGAVLDGWTDPIAEHDKKVLELEEAMIKEKDLVSTRKTREIWISRCVIRALLSHVFREA